MLMKEASEVIQEINHSIKELEQVMTLYEKANCSSKEYDNWRLSVSRMLNKSFTAQSISREFLTETKVFLNKFSDIENTKNIVATMDGAKGYLQEIIQDIELGKYDSVENNPEFIDNITALAIIRRILRNFHKHIEAMYQDDVHGNGQIKKDDLDRIRIGNEYDVQRILYALIRPIFPTARLEVSDDAGYHSVRYDIVINEYNIVIEVKCTRKNMSERQLAEELGADSFHYKADHLFLFIFDRVKLIKNMDAFEKLFNRGENDQERKIETTVIQQIIF